jgi:TolA-binding protein
VPILQASEQAAAHALELLNGGDLAGAEDAYTQLLGQYPTAGVAPEATFRLGYVQYMRGEFPQAIATLNKITSPPATPEIKAAGDALIPQAMAGAAAAMAPDDPGRKQAFNAAIQQYDAFVQKYQKSQQIESATYGRAMAEFQIQNYDEAEKALQASLQQFPNSDSSAETEDLLGVVLTADADNITRNHGDEGAAMAKYNEALGHLAAVIEKRADVVLANDAQFQIGEVLFGRAGAETGEKKDADLTHAIEAYQAVKPADAMVQAQQARLAATLVVMRQAEASRSAGEIAEAQRQQDRENAKLAAAKSAPDQTFNAQLRVAASYFILGKYDEARTLLTYLQPFAEQPDQKQQIMYYLALTYASQGLLEKAEGAFGDFQSTFHGAVLGENLPLVMGAMFLNAGQADKAVSYFEQERQLYPNSPLVNDALNQEAAALVREQKFDDAIATYQKFLATNPAKDQAAGAEQGIAAIYQQTGKMADAVKQYQKVADDYPGTPAAEECEFYAAALETGVDVKAAIPKLQAYATKYPQGKFTPQALMIIGEEQVAQGDSTGAMATFKDIVAKFPASPIAPQAYLQEASILAKAGKTDDMVALLRDFIKAYPDSKDIFYAYDTIGQTQVGEGKIPDAVATYQEMADDHSDNPMAAAALFKTAQLWRQLAVSQGQYASLNAGQKADWNKSVTASIAAAEGVLGKFPDSDQVGQALNTLLADQQILVDAQIKQPGDIDQYFHGLAAKYVTNPGLQSRILFTVATFTYQKAPDAGLAAMRAAYNPAVKYAPSDLDLYGTALLGRAMADDALAVYQKLAADYPLPAGATPGQAPPAIQEAQATALFGMATVLQKQNKVADAAKLYAQLKASYPWSPKVVEANFGIAQSLSDQGKYDDASKLLVPIVSSRTATAALRARAFLLIGDIQAAKGNIAAAIDSYMKTSVFFAGVPDAAAQGLWRGAQMLVKQAAGLTEQSTPKKSEQTAKAVTALKNIVSKYPDSTLVPQAQELLRTLGAP